MFGSEPVNVQLKEESVFDGRLKDIAAPYLGLATFFSLGAGAAGVAIAGWRHSSRRSQHIEQTLSGVQQQLQTKESQLEEVLLSHSSLAASGLDGFLQDSPAKSEPSIHHSPVSATHPEHSIAQPIVFATEEVQVKGLPSGYTTTHAIAPLPAAQAFLSFTHAGDSEKSAPQVWIEPSEPSPSLRELQEQLQQVLSHMELLQSSLEPSQHGSAVSTAKPKYVEPNASSSIGMRKLAS
ncbi:hypothetical protein H6F43_20260 [Leptolyngbya sp. FACHB-36]|uniref:hypothetical protein n=1 Tax=Leptolyngbya sp. FACHB-36 TaxID=2692808 RepID=UPI0016819185|nr:hypothetical protein [Leptolyngbya sp. FACHB-36]MBD2022518.1 hypothetical protein [Leptolyngbya sp. FACHB-36]